MLNFQVACAEKIQAKNEFFRCNNHFMTSLLFTFSIKSMDPNNDLKQKPIIFIHFFMT